MRKLIGSILCGLCLGVMGQTNPTTQGAGESAAASVSEMRVETLQGFAFLHFKAMTTTPQISQTMLTQTPGLMAAIKSSGILPHGPLIMILHGVSDDASKTFELDAGFAVAKGTLAPAGYEITDVPPDKSATVLFTGPLLQLRQAYHELYTSIVTTALRPGADVRCYILYFETVQSSNNVAMATIDLQ